MNSKEEKYYLALHALYERANNCDVAYPGSKNSICNKEYYMIENLIEKHFKLKKENKNLKKVVESLENTVENLENKIEEKQDKINELLLEIDSLDIELIEANKEAQRTKVIERVDENDMHYYVCSNCHMIVYREDDYCSNCGKRLIFDREE